jgi:hypothetical protein
MPVPPLAGCVWFGFHVRFAACSCPAIAATAAIANTFAAVVFRFALTVLSCR